MNRSQLDVFEPGDSADGRGRSHRVVGGVYYWDQKTISRNGRWQVNEFQQALMNPDNVFNNPVCSPLAAGGGPTIELLPSSTTNYRAIPGSAAADGRTIGGTLVADNPATADREDLLDVNATAPGQQTGINPRTGELFLANGAGAWQTCQQVYFKRDPGLVRRVLDRRARRLGRVRRGDDPPRRNSGPHGRCAPARPERLLAEPRADPGCHRPETDVADDVPRRRSVHRQQGRSAERVRVRPDDAPRRAAASVR